MKLAPPPVETEAEAALLEPMRRKARSLKGALIYVAQVHPAISHPVARVCSLMAKPTAQSYAAAKLILWWLHANRTLGVVYGAPGLRTLEDLLPKGEPLSPTDRNVDASLACSVDSDLASPTMPTSVEGSETAPADKQAARSQLGYVIMLAYGCLDACSRRQHSVAVDTPAAELFAASAAAAHLLSVQGALRFASFSVLGHDTVPVWCDNEVTVMVSKDASSVKRLAYIVRRVRLLQELDRRGVVRLHNVPGTANPADALTKHLKSPKDWLNYMTILYNRAANEFRSHGRPCDARAGGGVGERER